MSAMTLYGFSRSGSSHRLRIALNLKGLAYESRCRSTCAPSSTWAPNTWRSIRKAWCPRSSTKAGY